ncbi:hypothetical protein V6N12_057564 [Hibiscus sabdariffa]|uniref:RNase H type-1 domain-containing protein n=1 Tax=Hibiscus sabdariffa TaxID=183260 RepID=A0ABR2C5H8_9ROSI
MLHRHFNAPAIAHIIGIRCPDPLDVADRVMWRWTSQHTFVLKSAYMHLASSHWPPRQTIWKLIWRMAIPQRLRLFLWLAYQHKIMTNATRYCRNLAPSPICPLCGNLPESVLHTLRDCVDVRHLWSQILPDAVQRPFFGSNLHNWLSCNLSATFIHPTVGLPWPLIFSAFVWQMWKRRNDIVFNNDRQSDHSYCARIIAWARSFHGSISAPSAARDTAPSFANQVSWKAPEQGWVCLNVDGAVSLQSGFGAIGGLARDSLGDWLVGFSKPVGHSDALQTELWAIYTGLKFAWESGFRHLLVQSDCRQAIDLIYSNAASSSMLSLVRDITRLRRMDWEINIIWVPRDTNRAADIMAKLADTSDFSLRVFTDAPPEVVSFIELDKSRL